MLMILSIKLNEFFHDVYLYCLFVFQPNVSELAAMFGNKDVEAERSSFPQKVV